MRGFSSDAKCVETFHCESEFVIKVQMISELENTIERIVRIYNALTMDGRLCMHKERVCFNSNPRSHP